MYWEHDDDDDDDVNELWEAVFSAEDESSVSTLAVWLIYGSLNLKLDQVAQRVKHHHK